MTASNAYSAFACDLCGADRPIPIDVTRQYTRGEPLYTCGECGFVYVRYRRSAQAIADSWSDDLYGNRYTARIPAIKARQTYVADTLDVELGLKDKRVCDIGGGEGRFCDMLRSPPYGASVFAIEPSAANGRLLGDLGIEHFVGTAEAYHASEECRRRGPFDIATVVWTLENTQDAQAILNIAWDLLPVGGHLAVATGSRILVPFKKPLHLYIDDGVADTHCFRVSANTLCGLLAVTGIETMFLNRYLDSDILMAIGRKTDRSAPIPWTKDDPEAVVDFFERWHEETRQYYPQS